MTDMYWIGIDFPTHPTEEQMQEITDAIGDDLDEEVIVTSSEIEPMTRAEREQYIHDLTEALES